MDQNDVLAAARAAKNSVGLLRLLDTIGIRGPFQPAPPYRLPFRVSAREAQQGALLTTVLQMRRSIDDAGCRSVIHEVRAARPTLHHFVVIRDATSDQVHLVIAVVGAQLQRLSLNPNDVRMCDIDALWEVADTNVGTGTELALRLERALDHRRVSERFFRDVSACRTRLALAWQGVPSQAVSDREALALLLLSRLMFLYFLQRQGLLANDPFYLSRLLQSKRATPQTIYRSVLRVLFFDVLNRLPASRPMRASAFGELPYLNGGLFEEHPLERLRPQLDLPDAALLNVVSHVLEKYRFTTTEAAASDSAPGIEPEMLGRIFEGLMPAERRQQTGSFYTPNALVNRLVQRTLLTHVSRICDIRPESLHALCKGEDGAVDEWSCARIAEACERVTVIDPACGSGALLLGALDTLVLLRQRCVVDAATATELRRRLVARSLHGVDLLSDAALICSLRLWLALVPDPRQCAEVSPLPNLDRHIRQGDALIDPFDITAEAARELPQRFWSRLQRITAQLLPLADAYIGAGPDRKPKLRRGLQGLELQLARCWLHGLQHQLNQEERELTARASDRDLFGAAPTYAITAATRLREIVRYRYELAALSLALRQSRSLPFFSYRVHFPHARDGFDVVLMNPPWVRSHHWPTATRRLLRERYTVCAEAGWPYAAAVTKTPTAAGGQVDLSLLFLERGLRLLKRDGTLGAIVPAKLFRSLYAGGARALLLRHTRLCSIEDHSLNHRSVFAADAFPAVVVARYESDAPATRTVAVSMTSRHGSTQHFDATLEEITLRRGDPYSPWLLAPPECVAAFRKMQTVGLPLVESGLSVRRGAMSAANEALVLRNVQPKLGGLLQVRSHGAADARSSKRAGTRLIEQECVRPCLRGADVKAWRWEITQHVVWSPQNAQREAPLPPRLRRYLADHAELLGARRADGGMLRRLSTHTTQHKVVWPDLATSLRACAVPQHVRSCWGATVPVIPLNTIYFISTATLDTAMLLAAYLNSTPFRTFSRAIADRAKDGHFRFFAWTVGVLPLPRYWACGTRAAALQRLASSAHAAGGITADEQVQLDALVASAYGLSQSDMYALQSFDAWLSGGQAGA